MYGYISFPDLDFVEDAAIDTWQQGPVNRTQGQPSEALMAVCNCGLEESLSELPDAGVFSCKSAMGPYSGVGPKGYQRSDERILEELCERLTWHGDIDASAIQVSVHGGMVTLQGTTSSRHLRRMVEDLADSVAGVKDIQNELAISAGHSDRAAAGQPESVNS
jgi:hypothetical protein